jgi:hypothetical protein
MITNEQINKFIKFCEENPTEEGQKEKIQKRDKIVLKEKKIDDEKIKKIKENMEKYKFTCYPSVNKFTGECEGDTFEEALEDAQAVSDMNYGFPVLEEDLKLIEEDKE